MSPRSVAFERVDLLGGRSVPFDLGLFAFGSRASVLETRADRVALLRPMLLSFVVLLGRLVVLLGGVAMSLCTLLAHWAKRRQLVTGRSMASSGSLGPSTTTGSVPPRIPSKEASPELARRLISTIVKPET